MRPTSKVGTGLRHDMVFNGDKGSGSEDSSYAPGADHCRGYSLRVCLGHNSLPAVRTADQWIAGAHDGPAGPLADARAASRGYPVRLLGVVTFYDPYQAGHRALFIADRTGGIFVAPGDGAILPLHAGSLAKVSGVTDPGGFAPIISRSTIQVLDRSRPLLPARTVTLPHLLTGSEDGQWVSLKGIVRSAEFDGMHVVLSVVTGDGPVAAITDKEDGANLCRAG